MQAMLPEFPLELLCFRINANYFAFPELLHIKVLNPLKPIGFHMYHPL
jgi:hypothetical protein